MTEVQALIQLLCTGQAPLPSTAPAAPTDQLVRLLSLAEVLGLSLTGLTARTSQGRVIHIQEQSRENQPGHSSERSKTPPLPDSQKFRRSSQQQEMVKVRQPSCSDDSRRHSVGLAARKDLHLKAQDSSSDPSRKSLDQTRKVYPTEQNEETRLTSKPLDITNELERRLTNSQEKTSASSKPSLLSSTRKKISSSSRLSQHSSHFPFLRPRSPNSPPPGPQARVIMSNTALLDLMEIKKEVVDDEVVSELEGREEEVSDEGEEEEYPDMDNYGRNYVCCKCAKGFTFAKSFNWHMSRCQGGEGKGRETVNSLGKRETPVLKNENGDLKTNLVKTKAQTSRESTPRRQRSVTPQTKEKIERNGAKNTTNQQRERSVTPRGKVTLSKIQLAGPSPRKKELEKKIQLKKRKTERSESKSPPDKKSKRRPVASSTGSTSSPESKKSQKSKSPQKVPPHPTLKGAAARKKIDLAKKLALKKSQKEVAAKKVDLAKKVALTKSQEKVAAAVGRPYRGACGRCVKCRLPDCGKCAACVAGVQGLRGCVRKVCRNKGRRSVIGST